MDLIEVINQIDIDLFLYLNGQHNEVFDPIMEWVTHSKSWLPLYIAIIGSIIYKYKKAGVIVIASILLTIGFADQVSSRIIKPLVSRSRPCDNLSINKVIHGRQECTGQKGFFSSHASNTFALAGMLTLLFYKNEKWVLVFYLWAAIVSYSRIYLGLHYPGDIIAGAIFGIGSAYLALYLLRKYFPAILQEVQS